MSAAAGRDRSRPPWPNRAVRGYRVSPRAVLVGGRRDDIRLRPHGQIRHRRDHRERAGDRCEGDRPQASVAAGRGGRPRDVGRPRLRRRPYGHAPVLGGLRVALCRFQVPEQVVNDLFRANSGMRCVCRAVTAASSRACAWTCPTRTLLTTNGARRGRSTRPSTWTTCCMTCAVTTPSRPRNCGHLPEQPGAERPRRRRCQLGCLHAVDDVRGGPAWSALGRPRERDRLLPATLRAGDWPPGRDRPAQQQGGATRGLIARAAERPLARAEGVGLQSGLFLRRLREAGAAAARVAASACGGVSGSRGQFGRRSSGASAAATMQAPLVQFRDHTWMPYVPADASTPCVCWRSGIRRTSIPGRCICRGSRPSTRAGR